MVNSCRQVHSSRSSKKPCRNVWIREYPNNQYYNGKYYPYYPAYGGISLKFYDSIKHYLADSMLHSNCSSAKKESINKSINFKPGIIQAKIQISSSSIAVHLINASDTTFKFTVQDGWIPMIREAIDDSGKWQPVEFWLLNWCGVGYRKDSLQPNEQFIVRTFLYGGSYFTKIRFKFYLDGYILYSDIYEGLINKNQFILTTPRDYFSSYRSFLN